MVNENPQTRDSKPTSTVRSRKRTKHIVQNFLPVSEIRNDTVFLKNGGMRSIIEIEAINFNLKSEMEQQSIIAGYGAFVNTIDFPLQIVVRSTKTNIDPYLEHLESIGSTHTNALLKSQTLSYVRFLRHILEAVDVMQKRFYVIVPYDYQKRQLTRFEKFMSWIGGTTRDSTARAALRDAVFKKHNTQLRERIELIETGLTNIGLHTQRLNTRQLIELFYQIYNPTVAHTQKIPQDLELLNVKKDVL